MLSSPLVRRSLLLFAVFGVFCAVIRWLVTLSVPALDQNLAMVRGRLMVADLVLLIVGLFLVYQIARHWMLPIVEVTDASKRMAEAEHPDRVITDNVDEIGNLAHQFNEMVQKVEARFDELKRNQQRVTSDNEQLATVLEAMIEGVIAVDNDERILLANAAAIRLLNLKTFDVVGRRIWEAIRLPQIHDLIRNAITGEKQLRLEFNVPWTYSTVAVVASRLPGDPCPGVVLVLHDVTELRRLENLRRDFVSNVSHELKTPLAAITAYSETLLSGALEDPAVSTKFVKQIGEQSDRLNSLILDLLELARIESGEHVFHVDAVDINEVLRRSVDAHQEIARSNHLTLNVTYEDDRLLGRADEEGLRTIVDNLIGNAINYTPPGGTVTVRSRRDNLHAAIEVTDTGVGIAKEFQSRIFERFFRVDRARSREVGGTGLGLSIVKHLCQLFGGRVDVTSQLGQGSTFTVHLETAESSASATKQNRFSQSANGDA